MLGIGPNHSALVIIEDTLGSVSDVRAFLRCGLKDFQHRLT